MSDFISILWISAIAGLATTLGSMIVLMMGRLNEKTLAALLVGSGGVMLAVVAVDLLPTACKTGPLPQTLAGLAIGLAFMYFADRRINTSAPDLPMSRYQRLKRTGLLVAAGIALHDLPEGMAIAVGQEAESSLGFLIALAIALHNLPEGMATATPLKMAQISPIKIILLNLGIAIFPLGCLNRLNGSKPGPKLPCFLPGLGSRSHGFSCLRRAPSPLSGKRAPRCSVGRDCRVHHIHLHQFIS